jgi:muramoyltetrapeptide carboxypeptidase
MDIVKPNRLKPNMTIGVFTPSWPAHIYFKEKFEFGLKNIKASGFKYKLGHLTKNALHQGYKTAGAKERADEFMNLIKDPEVHAVMATIGGSISNGLLEFLDYKVIRDQRKPIIGYSDVTSLLLAIHAKSGLVVFYGPAVVPSMGEHPAPLPVTLNSFLKAVTDAEFKEWDLQEPPQWSRHLRNASTNEWKTESRIFQKNEGWLALNPGDAIGMSMVANLNTLSACMGTPYLPDFKNKILFLEQMLFEYDREERQLMQLKLAGIFDQISGLVVSKPEVIDTCNSILEIPDIYREIIGPRPYPIIWNFDCGHTSPSITIPIGVQIKITANEKCTVKITEPAVTAGSI